MDFEAEDEDFDDELLDLLALEPLLFRLLLDELEEEDCCWEFLLASAAFASASFSGDESDE